MAQWNGQYTGNTHSTKVGDLEATLRYAVTVFRNSDEKRNAKGKTVQKLAAKLLSARLKFLKAQIYNAEPVIAENEKKQNINIQTLLQLEAETRINGVNGILIEFGAQDLIEEI